MNEDAYRANVRADKDHWHAWRRFVQTADWRPGADVDRLVNRIVFTSDWGLNPRTGTPPRWSRNAQRLLGAIVGTPMLATVAVSISDRGHRERGFFHVQIEDTESYDGEAWGDNLALTLCRALLTMYEPPDDWSPAPVESWPA